MRFQLKKTEKLSSLNSLNLVTDIWTDAMMRSFIGFKVQGISDDWKMVKALLCCKQLVGSHTNESIFAAFLEITSEYKIEKKVFKILSDCASNMIKAFDNDHIGEYLENFLELFESIEVCSENTFELSQELNEVSRISYTAHRLQLAINDALAFDCAEDLIRKISYIINKGRHSCKIMDSLREAKKGSKTKNNTRWNSIFFMLKNFSNLKNEIRFDNEDRQRMSELIQMLQELQIATDMLQGDGVTISRIISTLLTIIQKVDLKSSHENLAAKVFYFENMSKNLISSIKKRLDEVLVESIAAILNQNYSTTWIRPGERSSWVSKLKQMVEEIDDSGQ
ncbi:unnamed protein product [Brachionus calyciflorus]|uniref:Uncharacterized protein n=1 Tax=Brachionus calyciflorus TaxID=104777 RepID=A0A813SSY0_9BILA|nr:unnamed protein product [Brachionus calyciflorus]